MSVVAVWELVCSGAVEEEEEASVTSRGGLLLSPGAWRERKGVLVTLRKGSLLTGWDGWVAGGSGSEMLIRGFWLGAIFVVCV